MSSPVELESKINKMILRVMEELAGLASEYIALAAYPVGFSFEYEGRTHRILSRSLRPEWEDIILYPINFGYWEHSGRVNPDEDIHYAIDDGVERCDTLTGEVLYLAWRQDFLNKIIKHISSKEE